MHQNNLSKYGITENIIEQILIILIQAGTIALKYHNSSNLKIDYKIDQSPVTNADIEVSNFIIAKISDLTPEIELISEENEPTNLVGQVFWLLDPIDGTKYYIQGSLGYTINLALVIDKTPVLGFVYHPSLAEIYYTNSQLQPILYDLSHMQRSICSNFDRSRLLRVIINNEQAKINQIEQQELFSKIYPRDDRNKISMFLTDQADLYYIEHQIKEWDTASGHAILKTLGGDILDKTGNVLEYGKPWFNNPQIIVCSHKAIMHKQIILNNNWL